MSIQVKVSSDCSRDYLTEAVAGAIHAAQGVLPDRREELQDALRRFVEAREDAILMSWSGADVEHCEDMREAPG